MTGTAYTPPSVQRLGAAVLLQGAAVPALARLAARGLRDRERDGLPASGALTALVRTLDEAADAQAAMSPDGPAGRPPVAVSASSVLPRDTLGSAEAAALLGVTPRQARRLTNDLGGWFDRGRLRFDRDAVTEYAARKDQACG